MGTASTAKTALAGMSKKPIWRSPRDTVSLKPAMSERAARRAMRGNRTVATATEKIPWGSM
jgi:hypothetical protein